MSTLLAENSALHQSLLTLQDARAALQAELDAARVEDAERRVKGR